jgi:Nitrile hydratase, alpha chain
MNQEEQGKKISQLIAKCWADEGFKHKLLADPAATLKTEGVEVPAGLSIKVLVLENDAKVFHLIIPAKPTDLSDEDLDKLATGTIYRPCIKICYNTSGCSGCVCV